MSTSDKNFSEIEEKKRERACILGYPIDLIDMTNSVNLLTNWIESSTGAQVVTLNAEMIMQSNKMQSLAMIIKKADLIVPDGIGIIFALKKLGINHVSRLPGIELAQTLIQKCVENNYSIGFLGASKDVLEILVNDLKLRNENTRIVFTHDGYFDENEEFKIIDQLKIAKPQVLFVALGVPKQELWIAKYKKLLNSSIMIGVGGSFDVWAKKVKRAPLVFRKLGLEWFFRLISQPNRFRRMFPTLPLFLIKVILDNKNTRKEY